MTETPSVRSLSGVLFLTRENAAFRKSGDFLALDLKTESGETSHARVFLHRCFPFDSADAFISVLDRDSTEIGLIRTLDALDNASRALVEEELARKYFCPKITQITSIKEKFHFSHWCVATELGTLEFTVRDTYRSMLRIGAERVFISDVDGNRYEIERLSALDKKSLRQIDTYL